MIIVTLCLAQSRAKIFRLTKAEPEISQSGRLLGVTVENKLEFALVENILLKASTPLDVSGII